MMTVIIYRTYMRAGIKRLRNFIGTFPSTSSYATCARTLWLLLLFPFFLFFTFEMPFDKYCAQCQKFTLTSVAISHQVAAYFTVRSPRGAEFLVLIRVETVRLFQFSYIGVVFSYVIRCAYEQAE